MSKKLWGGRFKQGTNIVMEKFSASVQFDQRLFGQDIRGSIAHARMLAHCGVIENHERDAIVAGLLEIYQEIENGDFNWRIDLEDVHMNIEAELTRRIGEPGKKLHTGRSRNDQVATDVRLFLRDAVDEIQTGLRVVQEALLNKAEQEVNTIMPGFTHMQSAQPVSCGHHLLAWFEMLQRDFERLTDCRKRINISPLGCAALAGTSFPIDREMTAKELGFESISRNSLDGVSDRDFMIEFNAAAALLGVHLSRMSEELVWWSSAQFGFVDLGDGFCTGSSIMPQKKNPDAAELVRGKSGRLTGNLVALITLMKGQPLAYNRDNQEDKEPVFDSVDVVIACLEVFSGMIPAMKFDRSRMRLAASQGYSTATDLADYLVRKGVPFRDAHEIVGKAVHFAESESIGLDDIDLKKLQDFSEHIEDDVYEVLTLEGSVNARNHVGGTAFERVRKEIQNAHERITLN
ncbi:MAG: argininosuccinate lyase [Parasphingorhabdus sp.]|jgi:argininosuccinate lyase